MTLDRGDLRIKDVLSEIRDFFEDLGPSAITMGILVMVISKLLFLVKVLPLGGVLKDFLAGAFAYVAFGYVKRYYMNLRRDIALV